MAAATTGDDEPVEDLALRLAALDPQASAALRVIAHFDSLVEARAGLQSIVRGAATLAGCPARLEDPAGRLSVRVLADGVTSRCDTGPDPAWPSARTSPPHGAVLWLERPGPGDALDSMMLERAVGAARAVLERTRARPVREDPALVELVLDATAPEQDRLVAARGLGLGLSGLARAVALGNGAAMVLPADGALPMGQRAGVGPVGAVGDLPTSWAAARLALRLTAEGTENAPGPQVVHADELGTLTLLVHAADAQHGPLPDMQKLDQASTAAPWMLATLDAVVGASSRRGAARALHVHHSTLQDRVGHAESVLGDS